MHRRAAGPASLGLVVVVAGSPTTSAAARRRASAHRVGLSGGRRVTTSLSARSAAARTPTAPAARPERRVTSRPEPASRATRARLRDEPRRPGVRHHDAHVRMLRHGRLRQGRGRQACPVWRGRHEFRGHVVRLQLRGDDRLRERPGVRPVQPVHQGLREQRGLRGEPGRARVEHDDGLLRGVRHRRRLRGEPSRARPATRWRTRAGAPRPPLRDVYRWQGVQVDGARAGAAGVRLRDQGRLPGRRVLPGPACVPACTSSSDCAGNKGSTACNTSTGLCVPCVTRRGLRGQSGRGDLRHDQERVRVLVRHRLSQRTRPATPWRASASPSARPTRIVRAATCRGRATVRSVSALQGGRATRRRRCVSGVSRARTAATSCATPRPMPASTACRLGDCTGNASGPVCAVTLNPPSAGGGAAGARPPRTARRRPAGTCARCTRME